MTNSARRADELEDFKRRTRNDLEEIKRLTDNPEVLRRCENIEASLEALT